MSEHFIKYIDIESYKCFRNFSANGFKRVNLISGKNNVGKTAFMESIYINVAGKNSSAVLISLLETFYMRERNDYISHVDIMKLIENLSGKFQNFSQKTDVRTVNLICKNEEGIKKYEVLINSVLGVVLASDFDSGFIINNKLDANIKFFVGSGVSQKSMRESFAVIQKKDQEERVYEVLKDFDDSILNVKVIGGEKIQCKTTAQDGAEVYRDLYDFGDGLKYYLSMILSLYACEGGYLFIDEIDTGIHYSSLDKVWEIILILSKEMDVQVFATTHSRECIESYCRVIEKLDDQDVSFTTLVKNKSKQIKAIAYDYEAFTNSIDQGHEVRGW